MKLSADEQDAEHWKSFFENILCRDKMTSSERNECSPNKNAQFINHTRVLHSPNSFFMSYLSQILLFWKALDINSLEIRVTEPMKV